MWQDMEASKMDIRDGSEWYLVEKEWLDTWKLYVGEEAKTDHPGPIDNHLLLENKEELSYDKNEPNFKDWLD